MKRLLALSLVLAGCGALAAEPSAVPSVGDAPVTIAAPPTASVDAATPEPSPACASAQVSVSDLAATAGLAKPATPASDSPPCVPTSSCSPNPLNPCSGTCAANLFSCTWFDTGYTACTLPNGGEISCTGGKTIQYSNCSCDCIGSGLCRGKQTVNVDCR